MPLCYQLTNKSLKRKSNHIKALQDGRIQRHGDFTTGEKMLLGLVGVMHK